MNLVSRRDKDTRTTHRGSGGTIEVGEVFDAKENLFTGEDQVSTSPRTVDENVRRSRPDRDC